MKHLRLYTTLGCHLCEQLEARLLPLLDSDIRLDRIEIAEDNRLVERYGERIPVLRDASGSEFAQGADWEALTEWLEERGLSKISDPAPREAAEVAPISRRGGRRVLG